MPNQNDNHQTTNAQMPARKKDFAKRPQAVGGSKPGSVDVSTAKPTVGAGTGVAGKPQGVPSVVISSAAGTAGTAAATAPAKKHTGRTVGIVIGAVVVIVAIVIACVLAFGQQDDFYDSNSLIGQAPYKTQEEIQAELDRIVEEGMLNISIASVIEFEDGESEGTAYIENVPGNKYVMKVDIALDDTDEVIYESGGLKPDNYIEKIRLNRDLDPGSYSATATFHALDPESLQEVGSAAAVVTLEVLN